MPAVINNRLLIFACVCVSMYLFRTPGGVKHSILTSDKHVRLFDIPSIKTKLFQLCNHSGRRKELVVQKKVPCTGILSTLWLFWHSYFASLFSGHKQQLIVLVVVGFLGSLAVFWSLFFLTFRQSLWLASSEDRSQNSVCALVQFVWIVEYLWLWDQLLSFSENG